MDIPLFVAVGAEPFNPRFVIRAGRREEVEGTPQVTLTLYPGDALTLIGDDAEAWLSFVAEHARPLVPPRPTQARAIECPVPSGPVEATA
jgi:hypothetical protein